MKLGLLIAVVITAIGLVESADHEPRCYSSFDFQEKLLEKMVVLNHRMDNLEKLMSEKMRKITETAYTITEEHSKLEKDMAKFSKDLKLEMRHKANHLATLSKEKMADADKAVEDLLARTRAGVADMEEQQKDYIGKASNEFDKLLESTESMIARMSADLVDKLNQTQPESKTKSVLFLARTVSNTSPGTNTQLVFTTTLVNTDNSYSTDTGEFTAPLHGTYWFSTQICGKDNEWAHIRMYVNDKLMNEANNKYDCFTANMVAVLNVGDKVYVKTGPNMASAIIQDATKWSTFMGTVIN